MKYIKTTLEAYKKYIRENNTDRIKKDEKLIVKNILSNKHPLYNIKHNPLKTIYTKHIEYDKNGRELATCEFKCNSGNSYNVHIAEIYPENFWLAYKHYNISFTVMSNQYGYMQPIQLGELHELFKRIIHILKDLNKLNNHSIYVVGNSFDTRRNLLHKDFIGNFGNADIKEGESSLFEKGNNTFYIKRISDCNIK